MQMAAASSHILLEIPRKLALNLYEKKDYEGLGTPDMKDLNLCLLGSWVKRHKG
jgi:hypothetical protein